MTISFLAALISEILVIGSVAIPAIIWLSRLIEGQKCQLRTAMLRTYYDCKDSKQIRQYEAENFHKNYHAYKALRGNSFIDGIYADVSEWEVIK